MTLLKIQTGTENKILRAKSAKVVKVSKKIGKLIADMKEALIEQDGLGLAAPQIGENIRLILVKIGKLTIPMVNPVIFDRSAETKIGEEGCLSLPGKYYDIARAREIAVKFQDAKGDSQVLKLSDLNARVVQHEVDHLDGVLIADY